MRLTKIYTKVGDKGSTMLATGAKVPKDSKRIESYGTVDELNSFLGLFRDTLTGLDKAQFDDVIEQLLIIQNEMHDIGGELATPVEALDVSKQQVVNQQSIARLEAHIDALNENLEPLKNFILPGGHKANSLGHVCRTICRRTERLVWSLAQEEEVREEPRVYLNRLSDWLFVATRTINHRLNIPETIWNQNKND